eukprot:COSAG06_NODE_2983_length_5987_cov_5.375679_1_plen_87_part_10
MLACLLACDTHTHASYPDNSLSVSSFETQMCLNIRFFLVYICQDRLGMDGVKKTRHLKQPDSLSTVSFRFIFWATTLLHGHGLERQA